MVQEKELSLKMHLGGGAVGRDNDWTLPAFVADTGILIRLAKRDPAVLSILSAMKAAGATIFVPEPVLRELGFGKSYQQNGDECHLVRCLLPTSIGIRAAFFGLIRGMTAGHIFTVEPDALVSYSARMRLQVMLDANPRCTPKAVLKHKEDAIIVSTAQNLRASLWTENVKHMVRLQLHLPSKFLIPVYTTENLTSACRGSELEFPMTDTWQKDSEVRSRLRVYQEMMLSRPADIPI